MKQTNTQKQQNQGNNCCHRHCCHIVVILQLKVKDGDCGGGDDGDGGGDDGGDDDGGDGDDDDGASPIEG